MAITPSLFQANSLAGEVVVLNNHANITIPLETFAFLGDKNLKIKLRRNSPTGDILKESPQITIKDYAEVNEFFSPVNYILEGSTLVFTVRTANVVDGSLVYYNINPTHPNVNSNDFLTNLTGYVRIENNVGRFTIAANADTSPISEEGETFNIILRSGSPDGDIITISSNVEIADTSSSVPGDLSANGEVFVEGSSIVFTIDPAFYTDGTQLYYKTVGNVTSSNFVQANLSTAAVQSNKFSLTLDTTTILPTEEERIFYLEVREDFQGGTLVGRSPNIRLIEPSARWASASGGILSTITVSGTRYNVHTFRNTAPGTYNSNTNKTVAPTTTWDNSYGGLQEFRINRLPLDTNTKIEYLVVGAGGAGGELNTGSGQGVWTGAGGGGGGGVVSGELDMSSSLAPNVSIRIGQGSLTSNGKPSSIDEWGLVAHGGGYGGQVNSLQRSALVGRGGTGGGQGYGAPSETYPAPSPVIKTNTQAGESAYPEQGSPGLATTLTGLGGGGGGGGPILSKVYPSTSLGNSNGMSGFESNITGSPVYYGGGGGGGVSYNYRPGGRGGLGGGGSGGYVVPPSYSVPRTVLPRNGDSHTGGGGGGLIKGSPEPSTFGTADTQRGRGGSGIVILRYPIGPA